MENLKNKYVFRRIKEFILYKKKNGFAIIFRKFFFFTIDILKNYCYEKWMFLGSVWLIFFKF